jgi:hypothetical protein
MTQDLANKLIAHYEEAIAKVEKADMGNLRKMIEGMYVDRGICWCAKHVFATNIDYDSWVSSKISPNNGGYWFTTPFVSFVCSDKTDVILCLRARINILKTFKE